jgi:hypothetical protein
MAGEERRGKAVSFSLGRIICHVWIVYVMCTSFLV